MNLFLKNVYVINLDRSKDRMYNMHKNLNSLGIQYKRISAVDGEKLSIEEIEKYADIMCRTVLCSRSIIGCALSHMNAWKNIRDSNDKWHLILEDDIEITDETLQFLNDLYKIEDELGDDVIINLSCPYMFCYNEFKKIKHEILKSPLLYASAGAYLITRTAAKKLLDTFPKIQWHIDEMIGFGSSSNIFMSHKCVVKHRGLDSSLNMSEHAFLPLFDKTLEFFKLSILRHSLKTTCLSLFMRFHISTYHLIALLLIVLNVVLIKSSFIYIYLITEFVIYVILLYKSVL